MVMNSGPHTLAWGPPRWTTRAEPPRRFERGDIVCAEIMPAYGNQEVQVQMSVALDPISATLVHSVSPHFLLGRTPVNMPADLGVRYVGPASAVRPVGNVPLQRGMVLALEPNACLGNHRVNIGGTVIVTDHGVDELNAIPTRLTHK